MTTRDFIFKWLLYTLGLVPVLLLEFVLFARMPIFGVLPMLLPLCAAVVASMEGAVAGAGFGLAVGVLAQAIYPALPGSMILGLPLIGLGAGALSRYGLQQTFLGCFLSSLAALICIDFVRVMWRWLAGRAALPVLLSLAGREIAWSMILMPLIYLVFRAIHRKVQAAFS